MSIVRSSSFFFLSLEYSGPLFEPGTETRLSLVWPISCIQWQELSMIVSHTPVYSLGMVWITFQMYRYSHTHLYMVWFKLQTDCTSLSKQSMLPGMIVISIIPFLTPDGKMCQSVDFFSFFSPKVELRNRLGYKVVCLFELSLFLLIWTALHQNLIDWNVFNVQETKSRYFVHMWRAW